MAQKETETGPSLELPSLFGRKKRRDEKPAAESREAERTADTAEPVEPVEPVDTAGPVETTETAAEPAAEPATATEPAIAPDPEPVDTSREDGATEVLPAPEPEPTAHTPAVTPAPVPTHPAAEIGSTPATAPTEKAARGRRRAKESSRTVPEVAATTAAFLIGALVGLAGCVLTWLGLQGCELVTGTDSCGGPGLLVLVVILVLMVLLGAAALRALRVTDPSNVSFLGVGVLAVVALVFLAEYLYDPWMFVVIPAVTAMSFAVARWITTLYAEDVLGDDDGMPHHDIR